MNKKLLAAALGVAFAAPVFADSSSLTIYGRVHQNLVHTSTDTTGGAETGGNFTLQDVSSRLGFRGEEDLGGGLKALFGYELSIASDNSQGSGLSAARHSYIGLAGSWGKFTAGTQDGGSASVAPLYGQAGMIGSVSNNGGTLTTVSGTINSASNVIAASQRKNNSFGYELKDGALHVAARHSLGGTDNQGNNVGAAAKENDERETEVAVTYKMGALTIGGGYSNIDFQTSTTPGAGSTQVEDLIQLVATYQLGSLKLGGIVNQRGYYVNQANGDDSDTNFALTGLYKLSGNTGVFGMIADGENNGNLVGVGVGAVNTPIDIQQFQLSAYYDFSKRTRSYVGFERVNTEVKATGVETDSDSLVIGLRHNF